MNSQSNSVVAVLIVLLVLLLLGGVGMMGYSGIGMGAGMMSGDGSHAGMMNGFGLNSFGAIARLLLWVLIIGGFLLVSVWIARNANHGDTSTGTNESPIHILEKRYARGEITKEQFETIKRDLGN